VRGRRLCVLSPAARGSDHSHGYRYGYGYGQPERLLAAVAYPFHRGLIEMPVRAAQPLAAMNTEKRQGQTYGSDRTNLASYKRDALLYRITRTPSQL